MTVAAPSLVVEDVAIERLQPDPANPRRIGDDELEALTRSLRQFGFVQPVLARREDSVVIGGHQRLSPPAGSGSRRCPSSGSTCRREQARLLDLALNKISGAWDEQLLARLLADLQQSDGLDLTLSGFAEDEVTELVKRLDAREKRERPETFDLDAALEAARREPRTKPGELWRLGDHRVLCGDATTPTTSAGSSAARRADMAFTDPPYNVASATTAASAEAARKRRIANDALDPEAWEAFVRAWSRLLVESVDGAIYVCMSSKEWPLVSRLLAEEGGHWSDTIIWAKDRFVLGRADYQRGYEPIWFGWREGVDHHWCGDRDQCDVWTIARPAEAPLHPVMKPLGLMERAIRNSSREEALVLDLFLGSGSTLIAAERTGRACYGLELDPRYADVILARWEAFSGDPAERVDG